MVVLGAGEVVAPEEGAAPLPEPPAAPDEEVCAQAVPVKRHAARSIPESLEAMCFLPTKGYRTSTRRPR